MPFGDWLTLMLTMCLQSPSTLSQASEFPPFLGLMLFHGVYGPQFLCPSVCWWTLGWFPPFGYGDSKDLSVLSDSYMLIIKLNILFY